jgi:hypothetical protein
VVQVAVEFQAELVQVVAQVGQPLGILDHGVEVVTVDDPQALSGRRDVHRFHRHLDTAEVQTGKLACEFVVVAGHKDDAAALAGALEQLLHHVVV